MTWRIWKYELPGAVTTLSVPIGARFLHLAVQEGRSSFSPTEVPCLWALVEDGSDRTDATIALVPTGAPAPGPLDGHYIGTIHLARGSFVLHGFHRFRDPAAPRPVIKPEGSDIFAELFGRGVDAAEGAR